MSKIKIGAQVTAKVRPTKVTVSGTFQGYRLEDQEDPTSICGTVLHVKDGMQHLDYVYVDSIKVCESEDERIRTALLRCCDDWEKGQFGCMAKEDVPAIRAYLERMKEQKPVEWSEEDDFMRDVILNTLERVGDYGTIGMQKDWLKSLRPQPYWKPSEEQIDALERCVDYLDDSDNEDAAVIGSLCHNLKKLM